MAVYASVLKDVFAGWPGRSADGSVLKHSPLSQTLPQLMNNNSEYLTDTYHIVGDKAFPLTQYILTPYKKSKRWSGTRAQKSITVNELIRTFSSHSVWRQEQTHCFFMQGMFSVHLVYFADELLLLIVAVCINSYYLLVSIIIAWRAGVCSFCFGSMFILASLLFS